MAQLVSPGVSVTVIDQPNFTSAGQGTVPLIFIATAANKLSIDGVTIAPGTQSSGVLYLSTSQRDLLTQFGLPVFETSEGTVIQGSEVSEYGLHAAFSYLGIANSAYVCRADIDLNQLKYSATPPTSAPANGTYWFNLTATDFGMFKANGNATPGLAWDHIVPLIPTATQVDVSFVPLTSFGVNGDYAVVTLTTSNAMYQKLGGSWYLIGSSAWTTASGLGNFQLHYATHVNIPVGTNSGDIWIKTTNPNFGANYIVEIYSITTGQFGIVTAPLYINDATANTAYGAAKAIGSLYVQYDTLSAGTATQTIKRWDGSNWNVLVYTASYLAPTNPPVQGTFWISDDFVVDVMVNNGSEWKGYKNMYSGTDASGVQITSAVPTTQANGNPLVANDLWLNSDDLVNYPALHRWDAINLVWTLIDKTDQTTPFGVVSADARSNADGTLNGATAPSAMLASDFVDPDAPNPQTFPAGILLFNTRFSSYNVKEWEPTLFTGQGAYTVGTYSNSGSWSTGANANPGRWVTASGNQLNGAPFMGRYAQHQMVVKAFQAMITNNDNIRSEFNFFNIMSAPGYPELIESMVELNVDRKETAFIIADVPMRLPADATSIQNWATNAADVAITNEQGRTNLYTYAAEYYPHGLGTNADGSSVVIPSSTIALRTYAYNDSVAYVWTPPAGTQRGIVQNATSVGYINSSNEFQPVILNQGQRDTLFTNDINPIAFLPNRGLVVYGDKTLDPNSDLETRVNVARLVCFLRYQLDQLGQPFLFQLNVDSTRSAVESVFKRFMGDLLSAGAITDFAVVCDTSNNTPTTIALNQLWIDIAIVPSQSIDFIYIPIRLQTTLGS